VGARRLFVAVEVPPGVVGALTHAIVPLRASATGLKWVRCEQYHLTLVFLGSVDEELVVPVRSAVAAGCQGVAAFRLALTGRVGTFRRTVLWAELEPSPQLASLAASVTAALRDVVVLPDGDRPFSAHLTLARAPRGERIDRSLLQASVPARQWDVDRIVLMQSQLSSKGSHYTVDTGFALRPV
jgi:RNA 2',3'-cyclic 3'-phosphodiesterase